MAGRGGFTDLGYLLILAGADTLQKAVFAAVQHPVQHLDLLGTQRLAAVLLPETALGQGAGDRLLGLLQRGIEQPTERSQLATPHQPMMG